MNTLNQIILSTPLPSLRNPRLRRETRKTRAVEVRRLFKDLNLKGISVTAPHYSMAQSIDITLPLESPEDNQAHYQEHEVIDERERDTLPWMGYGHYCPRCQEKRQAKQHLEKIILAAFPDLDDRIDTQSDYFDYCLSIS